MHFLLKCFLLFLLSLSCICAPSFVNYGFTNQAFAKQGSILIKDIKLGKGGMVKISLSSKPVFKVFTLSDPHRMVVDISDAKLSNDLPIDRLQKELDLATSFHGGDENYVRLVFTMDERIMISETIYDNKSSSIIIKFHLKEKNSSNSNLPKAKEAAEPKESTFEKNHKENAKQVSEDLIIQKVTQFDSDTKRIVEKDGTARYVFKRRVEREMEVKEAPKKAQEENITEARSQIIKEKEAKEGEMIITPKKSKKTPPIIVIDAGHGGKDPGTIGVDKGTKEKNITLLYARKLARALEDAGGFKVYLTRNEDIFLPLRVRVEKARKKKADLFISIHANATSDNVISGFSVYTLSENSSDRQAELLAQKENRSDIISDLDFTGHSRDIMKTLIDLSLRDAKNKSSIVANTVIESIKKADIQIVQNTHRFAGFAVLTAPDMASMLIELGYLSNREEEELLSNKHYQARVVSALVEAVGRYFQENKI